MTAMATWKFGREKPEMSQPAKQYDIMKDVVVRAGIRDRMIADMRKALEDIANWTGYAKQHEFSRGAKGAEEHARQALERFKKTWKQL